MLSYHDHIQEVARRIEQERAKFYTKTEPIIWTETQICYLYGAIYKLLRVKNQTKSKQKAKDDVLDAYNYCALLFENILQEELIQ